MVNLYNKDILFGFYTVYNKAATQSKFKSKKVIRPDNLIGNPDHYWNRL